jgi:hypothetical protein
LTVIDRPFAGKGGCAGAGGEVSVGSAGVADAASAAACSFCEFDSTCCAVSWSALICCAFSRCSLRVPVGFQVLAHEVASISAETIDCSGNSLCEPRDVSMSRGKAHPDRAVKGRRPLSR